MVEDRYWLEGYGVELEMLWDEVDGNDLEDIVDAVAEIDGEPFFEIVEKDF